MVIIDNKFNILCVFQRKLFEITVAALPNNFNRMCLFFGQLVQDCDHAECQIVYTIKTLNEQSLFTQVLSRHNNFEAEGRRQDNNLPSISNFIDEQQDELVLKAEDNDPLSMQQHCDSLNAGRDEYYRYKIERLEREVGELRSLTLWMKNELEKKGLLS